MVGYLNYWVIDMYIDFSLILRVEGVFQKKLIFKECLFYSCFFFSLREFSEF